MQRTGAPLTCLQGRWAWLIPTLQVGTPIKEESGCWAFSKPGSGKNSNDNEDNGEDRHLVTVPCTLLGSLDIIKGLKNWGSEDKLPGCEI